MVIDLNKFLDSVIRIEIIEWVDAIYSCASQYEQAEVDEVSKELCKITTVGILVCENEKVVGLAGSFMTDSGDSRHITYIPKVCILKRSTVEAVEMVEGTEEEKK